MLIGRASLLDQHGIALPADLAAVRRDAESQGRTAVLVAWDGTARAVFVVADTIKPTSRDAVAGLRGLGLRPVLLTGDNAAAARAVADEVGIAEVIAEVLPRDKVDAVARLQREGRVVAMVGDGVNDAAALAQSDLGLAMGTGTDVAIEASDLTLVRGDLRAAVDAIRLARRTLSTIKANLFWAFAYNLAALPAGRAGAAQPAHRRCRDGAVERVRGVQQPAAAAFPQPLQPARRTAISRKTLRHNHPRAPRLDTCTATAGRPQLDSSTAIAARLESVVDALAHQRDPASP